MPLLSHPFPTIHGPQPLTSPQTSEIHPSNPQTWLRSKSREHHHSELAFEACTAQAPLQPLLQMLPTGHTALNVFRGPSLSPTSRP